MGIQLNLNISLDAHFCNKFYYIKFSKNWCTPHKFYSKLNVF